MSQRLDSSYPIFYGLPRSTWPLILAAFGIAVYLCRGGLGYMVGSWLGSDEYSHALLIPPIVAFLIWQRKDIIGRTGFDGSWAGPVVVGMGVALEVLGRLATLQVFQQYALLIILYGLVLSMVGWRIVKLIRMPLLLLLFMIPLPQFLLQNFSAQLQLISSQLGVLFIRLFGISVFVEGNVIDLGSYKLQVAEACSGLRYLFPLMTIGVIVAYFFNAPMWKRVVVFLSSIPITILMNSFRIGVIGVLVEHWGTRMAEGFIHEFEGWVVFMASIAVLLLEIKVLNRFSRDHRPWREVFGLDFPAPTPANAKKILNPVPPQLITSLLLLAVLTAGFSMLPERIETIPSRAMLANFPNSIGDWQGHQVAMEQAYLDQLKLDDYLLADYSRPGAAPINFYVAWYNSQAAGESVHSPRSCLPGGGWRITSFSQEDLSPLHVGAHPLRVNRVVIEYGTQRQLVYYWFQQRGRVITNEYLVKWYLLLDSLKLHRTDGALVRVIVPLLDSQTAADADHELVKFVGQAAPLLDKFVPD